MNAARGIWQQSNSPEFVTEMRFWHWIRMNLQPYLIATAFKCAAEKVPMMCPLVYEWPQDKAAHQVEDEFLLGDAILVAPLLEENCKRSLSAGGRMVCLFYGKMLSWLPDNFYDGRYEISCFYPQWLCSSFARRWYGFSW